MWALGISAIEMAEVTPPRWAVHPMRVIFMISREPPPRLADAQRWSPAFHAFVAAALTKARSPLLRSRCSPRRLLWQPVTMLTTAALADDRERRSLAIWALKSRAIDHLHVRGASVHGRPSRKLILSTLTVSTAAQEFPTSPGMRAMRERAR